MKRLLLVLGLLVPALMIKAQESQITQDPQAKEVLDGVALKIKSVKSIQADFELVIEDRKEKTKNSSKGSLVIKQKKYKIISEGSTIYFDGTTMWTYTSINNEVTISEPGMQDDDFMGNPAGFFTLYNRDYKYRYVRESVMNGSRCHEIDLFPKNLNQPYSRIKVFIGVKTNLPEIISSIGKDGVDYTVFLRNTVTDHDIAETTFTFDPAKYKKVEIVDMRGIK